MLQAMFAALLYSTAGLALTAVGLLGVMAATAFASIFFAVIGGMPQSVVVNACILLAMIFESLLLPSSNSSMFGKLGMQA